MLPEKILNWTKNDKLNKVKEIHTMMTKSLNNEPVSRQPNNCTKNISGKSKKFPMTASKIVKIDLKNNLCPSKNDLKIGSVRSE